jgi:hypothetical protein
MKKELIDVSKILNDILNIDNKYKLELDFNGLSFDFTCKKIDLIDYISINYLDTYDSIRFSNAIVFGIVFPQINQILSEVLNKKNCINDLTIVADINLKIIQRELIYKNSELIIVQKKRAEKNIFVFEENCKIISIRIFQYLNINVFPFFERVKDLQYVNDEIIDKMPKEKYGDYIPGRYMNAKVLIIMKLCNNPRYWEYRNWALGAYLKGVEINPDRYLEDFNVIKSLVEYLDSGKYLEVV